mgnify:CR=1 FL=1
MPTNCHKLPPKELDLKTALVKEQELLSRAEVPVVTVSATYKKELSEKYEKPAQARGDVVFSRAHYSMARAVVEAAKRLNQSSHLVDPTNFVSAKDWKTVQFTETVGKLMARFKVLKWLKDRIDTAARNKLPITEAIAKPLEFLTRDINRPVISLHYEVGNQLASWLRPVIQVVTDPHIRPQYLYALPSEQITYCVFDQATKKDLLKEAARQNRFINQDKIIITGPPVDPRISIVAKNKNNLNKDSVLNLAVCTGGLGTNLPEIKEVLTQLKSWLRPPAKIRLFLYAGTHRHFRDYFEDYARELNVRVGDLNDKQAAIRILYDDSIIDANENLIKYMFPWAEGVITKPSGDMAYEAAAAGCFLLFLESWGEWEENIQKRFIQRKIGYDLKVWRSFHQLKSLWSRGSLKEAMINAKKLPLIFRQGAENIVKAQQKQLGC